MTVGIISSDNGYHKVYEDNDDGGDAYQDNDDDHDRLWQAILGLGDV